MSDQSESVYYALNVSLFAFTLQSGSLNRQLDSDLYGQKNIVSVDVQTFKKEYEKLLNDNFREKFTFSNSFPELRQEFPDSNQYELLNAKKKGAQFVRFSSQEKKQNPIAPKPLYRLLLYPQKISDSYALLINIFRPQASGFDGVKLNEIPEFNPNQCLTLKENEYFIGETLLITAFLHQAKPANAEELIFHAEQLLKQLLNGFCPEFYQAEKFLDSYILEFARPQKSQIRYLILFYFGESTSKQLKEVYWDLPELFLYYHKITQVFQMSRKFTKDINDLILEEIESQSKLPESVDLEVLKTQLKKLLKTAPEYTLQVRKLEKAFNTININSRNYQRALTRLQAKVDDNLDLFNKFYERESQTFQLQIQADLNYSKPASQLLDQAIASIRGLVEIDQAESDRALVKVEKEREIQRQEGLRKKEEDDKNRDRKLQIVVAVVGVGVGVAGVAATASPYLIEAKPENQKLTLIPFHLQPSFGLNQPHHLTLSVLFSLGAGLLGVAIAARVMRYIQKHPKSAIARTMELILGSSQEEENSRTKLSLSQQPEKERSHTSKNS